MDKLIIFDMDNTLIHSHIDFKLLKDESYRLLRAAGLTPDHSLPVTQTLAAFKQQNLLPQELEQAVWDAIVRIEADGLAQATMEPQVELMLQSLVGRAHVVVLTNNDEPSALASLGHLGLAGCFERIMGRGSAPELKPAPGGMLALLADYPHLTAANALAVGDATIDIRAAYGAGLRFCAYNRSRPENWQAAGFTPDAQLYGWDKSSADTLLALF